MECEIVVKKNYNNFENYLIATFSLLSNYTMRPSNTAEEISEIQTEISIQFSEGLRQS